ncbi:unnamed protein product [Spirodela intermedia]|uniref:Uncharacterized protein n=1 Tax=Spirodela intermedia TaxID=51605 RepID=A0A7I8IAL4_SPIIN|nr:unnamed protein product [Spirodela intermedia]CAA6653921.1 unnamed protein product [Spirodela intermedia]
MEDCLPGGTIFFTTVGVQLYGFDVFSVPVGALPADRPPETRHTDGVSVNFNGQFLEDDGPQGVAFVSERSGSARPFLARMGRPEPLPHFPASLHHDRPVVRNGVVYLASAHEWPAGGLFRSWSAVYSAPVDRPEAVPERLTPAGNADLSPAVSASGEILAVASYGSSHWKGDFHELQMEVVVFRRSDPSRRVPVSGGRGGWPAWSGDSTVFFHRVAEDGWWSVFRVDIISELDVVGPPRRVTPPGIHAFTPAASRYGNRIAVATRRRESQFRHIELFDLKTEEFLPVTALVNPDFHHYNPFLSDSGDRLGYHRFRGEAAAGSDSVVPHLSPVASPVAGLKMSRVYGTFPSFSPAGDIIAINGDFESGPGLMILSSDGSRRWPLLQKSAAIPHFLEPRRARSNLHLVRPIFRGPEVTVHVARISFDPASLEHVADGDLVPSEVKILTRADTRNNAFPSCSPDGKWVIRRLTDGDWIDTMPCWSPDGELIAFSSNRHSPKDPEVFGLYLVRPDGEDLRRVPVAGPDGSEEARRERSNHVCFSPNSKWLLFTSNITGVVAEPVGLPNHFQPYGDLFACRTADGGGYGG